MKKFLTCLMFCLMGYLPANAQFVVSDPGLTATNNVNAATQIANMLEQLKKAEETLEKVEKVNQNIRAVQSVYNSISRLERSIEDCGSFMGARGVVVNLGSMATTVGYATKSLTLLFSNGSLNMSDKERLEKIGMICQQMNRLSSKLNSIAMRAQCDELFLETIF